MGNLSTRRNDNQSDNERNDNNLNEDEQKVDIPKHDQVSNVGLSLNFIISQI